MPGNDLCGIVDDHHRMAAVLVALIQLLAALLDYWAGGE
jgi:hypothetical protein